MNAAVLETAIDRLALSGRAAPLGGDATCSLTIASRHAQAVTRPSFVGTGPPAQTNTDNVLLREVSVQGEPAVLVAIAHGNYKSNAGAFACAAAVMAFDETFGAPLLADADVAPTLRRAMLSADEAISTLRGALVGVMLRERLRIQHVTRLGAIGCSVIALVATRTHAWLAHVGENRAFLLPREGPARQLAHPHVLAGEGIVLRLLGAGSPNLTMDVTRAPLAPGDRVVLGNATLTDVPPDAQIAGDALFSQLLERAGRDFEHVPTTLAIVG